MNTVIDAKLALAIRELSRDQCVDVLEATFGSGLYDNQTADDLRQLVTNSCERGLVVAEEIYGA